MKLIIFIGVLFLFGCYTERKAKEQFGKAVSSYPEIGSNFCAITYPPKDTTIRDTTRTSETIYLPGEERTDTVKVLDTIRITKTIKLPGSHTRDTVWITNTVKVTDQAALKSCDLERQKVVNLLVAKTADYDKMKKTRNIWMIIAICCFVIIGVGTYLKLKKSIL